MVKTLLPAAIPGPATMTGICQARVNLAALDQPQQATRIRLRSTVISLEHEGEAKRSPHVTIVYFREGRLHRVRARSVILANGKLDDQLHCSRSAGGVSPRVCAVLSRSLHHGECGGTQLALPGKVRHQPVPVVRRDRQLPGVRRVATFGGGAPVLSPDSPTVLTLKILFANPGKSLPEQINTGAIR